MSFGSRETNVLRGVAIILIVLHNVTHIFCPFQENEFGFSAERVSNFFSNFHTMPFTALFSFYGWAGVSVFVFSSAYGLMAKYGGSRLKPFRWLGNHYLKLFLLMAPCLFLLFIVAKGMIGGEWELGLYFLEQTFLLNITDPFAIVPGIYWYVGMAFQLYVFFLLVRKLGTRSLAVLWIVSAVFLALTPGIEYMRHNFAGWIPEFVFGMLWYRCRGIRLGKRAAAMLPFLLLALFVIASAQRYTFFLCGVFFVALLLSIRGLLARIPLMHRLGVLSASVYVLHALVRSCLVSLMNRGVVPSGEDWILLYAVLVFVAAVLLAIPYNHYYKKVCRLF